MNRTDDACWDEVMAQLDLDVGDLRAAEAKLSAGQDAPLAEPVAALVARATGAALAPVPVLRLVPERSKKARVAALLLGGALLAAAGYLVYAGRESSWTMTHRDALELLQSSDAPEKYRRSAMGQITLRLVHGIDTLKAIRDDAAAPPALAAGARLGLQRLLTLLAVEPPQRLGKFLEDLNLVAYRAQNAALTPDVRGRELERVILAAGSYIGELRCMTGLSADLVKSRDQHLRNMQHLLTR